ncbi:hypothetical protein ACFFGT_23200 [Mucilaginibacter angelicae]|uniref:Uncharacterized protein n=1 Tax=Mucilaginibacter angelicae TaxID=869718 RepID=A0ABV6LCC3_9SPHI
MKFDNLKWIVATLVALFWAIILTCDALTADFDGDNVVINALHLRAITKNTGGRGSLNYGLYVQENDKHYQIGANWADCFYYDTFVDNVKPGHVIRLSVLKTNGLIMNNDLLEVVNVDVDGVTYLSHDCARDSIENQKKILPFAWLLAIGLFTYCYFKIYRKRKIK